jgi:gliding motility-associated-like protein
MNSSPTFSNVTLKLAMLFTLVSISYLAISQCKPIISLQFKGNALDDSGNNNNGILGGVLNKPILTQDRFNNPNSAYLFGGFYNQNWISVPNSPSLKFSKSLSLSLWFKQCSFAGMDGNGKYAAYGYFQLFSKAGDGITAEPGIWCGTGTDNTGLLHVNFNNRNGQRGPINFAEDTTVTCFDTCEWVHLVVVINDDIWKMYFNGKLQKEKRIYDADFTEANSRDLVIGRMLGGGNIWYPFNGVIDDVNLYNCAIDQNIIDSLYGDYSDPLQSSAVARANKTSICPGDSLYLKADQRINASYSWTGPNGFISSNLNVIIPNFKQINSGKYILTVRVGNCSISRDTIEIKLENCIKSCLGPALSLNTGRDPLTGSLLSDFSEDKYWLITSIKNAYLEPGRILPYHPFVTPTIGPYYNTTNSKYLSFSKTNCQAGQPATGPLDPEIVMARNFITVRPDSFRVKIQFLVDNYINYFSIDGTTFFSSMPTPLQWPFRSPNLALDTIIYLNEGCHDITCSFSDYNDGKIITQGCTSINIDGFLKSLSSDSSILQEACFENKAPIVKGDNDIKICKKCELISPNYSIYGGRYCTNISTVKVYFEEGYEKSVDTFLLDTKYNVQVNFNSNTGVLTLSGNFNFGVWEEIIRSLCYQENGKTTLKRKKIVIILGDALFNSANGHYYKLVNNVNPISWHAAKSGAAASNYFGLQGYLVTITDSVENNFLTSLIQSNSWIGASDSALEGEWRWVTGCEGLENAGQGRYFSQQQGTCNAITGTGSVVGGYYNKWDAPEPNDASCIEDYAHIWAVNGGGPSTYWNDFPDNGVNIVFSYIIEYGCMPNDPIINLASKITINILPIKDTLISKTICQGTTYLGYNTTGIFIDTFISNFGCDSIRTLNLIVNNLPVITIDASQNDSICLGQSVILTASGAANYSWSGGITNGVEFTPTVTTTYTVTATSAEGCITTVSQNITVLPIPKLSITTSPIPAIICEGDGISLTASGADNYIWDGGVSNGVAFYPHQTKRYTVTGISTFGCLSSASQEVIVNKTNDINFVQTICEGESFLGYNKSGNYTIRLINIYGCDSVINLNLNVNPVNSTTTNVSICEGDRYIVGNHSYTSIGTYRDTFQSAQNCDSILISILSIKPENTLNLKIEICQGESFQVGNNYYAKEGKYSASLQNSFGCDSIINIDLKVKSNSSSNLAIELCAGESFQIGQSNYSREGNYIDTLISQNGCDSIANTNLIIHPTYFQDNVVEICKGETYSIGKNKYQTSGRYYDVIPSIKGCDSTIITSLTIRACRHIYVPNVFSPNGDNLNDIFKADGIDILNFEMRIYDRWGEMIFISKDIDQGWNGIFKGSELNPGVYIYLIKGQYTNGNSFSLDGDLTLLR